MQKVVIGSDVSGARLSVCIDPGVAAPDALEELRGRNDVCGHAVLREGS